jgi:hypothetical protein
MKSPLHILHLEDDPNDAALINPPLKPGHRLCDDHRVQTAMILWRRSNLAALT